MGKRKSKIQNKRAAIGQGLLGFVTLGGGTFIWNVVRAYAEENINRFPWRDPLFWVVIALSALVSYLWAKLKIVEGEKRDQEYNVKPKVDQGDAIPEKPANNLPQINLSKDGLLVESHDHLLIESELQRSGGVTASKDKEPLRSLAVVVFTFSNLSQTTIGRVSFHLKRFREGRILSALPQRVGYPNYKSYIELTSLGMVVKLEGMAPKELFRLQMLTDGLRETDFYVEPEGGDAGLTINVFQQPEWIP
jgi:hypothetical protein